MGASASLKQPIVSVEPGGQAAVEIQVKNTGTVVDQFTIEVLGDAGIWATADPPTLSLFPETQGTSQVTFRPPREPSTPAGTIAFGIMVRSHEDPSGSAVEEGSLAVGAFMAPSAELIPRTSRGSRTGRHDVAVDNRGNVRLEATLEGLDPDKLVRFEFDPPSLAVDPGTAGFAKARVKPAQTFWRGLPKSRPFQIAVRPDAEGASPLLLDGSFLQESILPPWFMRAIAAIVALLIGGALLWFLVLQPQFRTSAEQALVDFGFSPQPGSVAAGAGTGAGGGATPTPGTSGPGSSGSGTATGPSPTPLKVSPPPGGGQTPVDGRLDQKQNALTVSSGTLFITDLVFSNPTGAAGSLVLQRNTSQLLVLQLDNFRDLDFHFVTPVVVAKGQTLALVAACTSAGGGATPPPACSPAVFYSGYLQNP